MWDREGPRVVHVHSSYAHAVLLLAKAASSQRSTSFCWGLYCSTSRERWAVLFNRDLWVTLAMPANHRCKNRRSLWFLCLAQQLETNWEECFSLYFAAVVEEASWAQFPVLLRKQSKSKHNTKRMLKQERVLPAGVHEVPFSYTLPKSLPTSFEGEFGHIRYTCRVSSAPSHDVFVFSFFVNFFVLLFVYLHSLSHEVSGLLAPSKSYDEQLFTTVLRILFPPDWYSPTSWSNVYQT